MRRTIGDVKHNSRRVSSLGEIYNRRMASGSLNTAARTNDNEVEEDDNENYELY